MASSSVRFSDDERSLQALFEAFGSFCSLEEIASAYCRSKGDLLAAGDILCKVQDSKSLGSVNEQREKITQGLANDQNGHKSQDPADEQSLKIDISGQETETCEISTGMHVKMSKSKKATASVGTVSSILGNSYNRHSYSVKEKFEKAKPIKIEVPKSVVDALDVGSSSSGFQGSKKESLSNREIEQFLFSMLGDGFKLSMDVIREVLGSCGYDIHKSMEELLDFSTVSLGKGKAIDDTDTAREYKQCTGSSSREVSISVENTNSLESNSHCTKSNLKDNFDVSQQVLQSLFTVPERVTDEPFKPRFDLGANRLRSSGSVVSKPLQEVKMPMPVNDVLRYQRESMKMVPDEDDGYKNLRDVTKQHWDLMKEYYEAAITAFANGDHQHQNYFLEQGKHYFKLAREFEEKSARHVAGSTKKEDGEHPLDLLNINDSKDALYLLKMHICKLVNIPNLQYLKVNFGPESKDAKKTKIKRKVIHFLEKESIQWTETESDPGTVSIRLDQIDYSKLSFAKKIKDIQV
ncbi:silencing defective 5 isoform X2 [Carex rostrata]